MTESRTPGQLRQMLCGRGQPRVSLLDGGASLGAPATNKLARGAALGEAVCLACPEIDRVGVSGSARSCSQRRSEVEHVRVGRRCVCAVVAHEGVDDASGAAAAEGARESRGTRTGERISMRIAGSGFGATQERGPDLGCPCAGGDDGGHGGPVGDTAGGDQRKLAGPRDEPQLRKEPDLAAAVGVLE